jgi:uncharacterized protein YacL
MYDSLPLQPKEGGITPTIFTLQVEKLRLIAYMAFWGMCLFAMVVSKAAVAGSLGPCPLNEGDEPTYGMHCSVLMDTFGFNNICVYWDYSPSREATALVYPIFEYTLALYVVMGYLQIKNDYDNKKADSVIYNAASVLLWIKIILIAWFRMIFVCSVFQTPIPFFGTEMPAVVAHTLGFFGMQFALILIAVENVVYIVYNKKTMLSMSVETTKVMAIVYVVVLAVITGLKISWASSIFITGTPWIGAPWPHIFDRVWMLLAAVMPVFFSLYGMKTEPDMVISIVNQPSGST